MKLPLKPQNKPLSVAEQNFLDAYELYAEAIYRHCVFRVYDAARAEDMMQETFMKTWKYISQGKIINNIRPFLYRVANNLVIDYSRKKKEDSLEMLMELHPDNEPSANPISQLENVMVLETVMKDLKKLPIESQEILVMRYIDDLDPKEIASILEITPNNASVRINRAMRHLQQILNKKL